MEEYPLCKYAFYEKQPNRMVVLKCSKSNELCAYSRYCSRLLKVIHTSAYRNCATSKQ
ncbi:MAG: hypothetical protein ACLTPN_02695 [Clostridia bacterium]|jgi:hypothetical protein